MQGCGPIFLTLFLIFAGCVTGSKYEIITYTGSKFGAGTDARVFIILFGEKGRSKEIELESKGRNDFEKGQKDTFFIQAKDLGRLTAINIRHDNSWFGSGWFLEKVRIKPTDGCVYEFPNHKWLASTYGDEKISRHIIGRTHCRKKETPPAGCHGILGVSTGLIKDSQLSASSSYDERHQPYHARLNKTVQGSRGGWCSAFADETEFLEVNLGNKTNVSGISTQGQSMFDNWVTKYALSYSLNGKHWFMVKDKKNGNGKLKTFTGNKDRNTVVTHWFPEITARHLRVLPLKWSGLTNCMRIELYGCRNVTLKHKVSAAKQGHEKETKNGKLMGKGAEGEEDQTKGKLCIQDLNLMAIIEQAVVYLRFENIYKDNILVDESQKHNNAKIVNFARIARFSETCGNGVDLNGGDILLSGASFHNKPRVAITIAAWIKLFSVEGTNSLFDTIGGLNSTHDNGQYHLEIDDGSVRWFHRNENGEIIFNVTSEVIVPSHVWTHVACTYEAKLGQADIYVNAKFILRGDGSGDLSQDWQEKAGIGEHKGERLFDGQIDEFYMSNEALSQEDIKKLMQRCEFEKECFSPLGMEDMNIKDGQITASSTYSLHKPFYGRLNLVSFYDDPQRTAWCADEDDKEPYLTVDLKEEKTISGVALQGASLTENYVTSFKLCHSQDGRTFKCVSENLTGETDFPIKSIQFSPVIDPFVAWASFGECSVSCGKGTKKRVVKCQPKGNERNQNCPPGTESYTQRIPCTKPSCPECFSPMGMSNGTILDHEISGSSTIDEAHPAFYARVITERNERVSTRGSWCAKVADHSQFLEIDLKKPRKVTGIGTQGQVTDGRWVSQYGITYSHSFKPVEVTDNEVSSFKMTESGSHIANKQSLEKTQGKSPFIELSPNKSKQRLLHIVGNKTVHHDASDVLVAPRNKQKAPLRSQTHVVNLTDQNNNFRVLEIPQHVHPNLPPLGVAVSATLNRQHSNDLHGSKASDIHNARILQQWGAFSKCSVTCGEGIMKRYRKCGVEECTAPGLETQVVPCSRSSCPADAFQWSFYSSCSVTCGVGKRTRSRMCDGVSCPKSGSEFETISCVLPGCPVFLTINGARKRVKWSVCCQVLYLGFEKWEDQVILDESDMGNNAFLNNGAFIAPHKGMCGHFASLGKSGDILLEDTTFRGKPRNGVTVALWVNLARTSRGIHSLFSTARVMTIGQIMGGYHFEIDDGKVRWFHRNRNQIPVFSAITDDIVRPDVWTHLIGSYNSTTLDAKVYVNGALRAMSKGYGHLDDFWGYKACVGSFDLGGRYLGGFVDDFHIFNYAIEPGQIKDILRIKCPTKI
ncbi:EGF-like repeat and discoidin I-like domain-containing protein 3 [Acropora cervicornis]|uniref:EGF-like repeat and discoidin I-like domain-containing protein 3 n=1 Tax=Acropora cervicornis TaxID=6130 RepID=A0AAD9QMZ9_ACRCE|nr:EGF-like repeat and discoidin I-like domain-containing protein 3 [Acropora cervicornis]